MMSSIYNWIMYKITFNTAFILSLHTAFNTAFNLSLHTAFNLSFNTAFNTTFNTAFNLPILRELNLFLDGIEIESIIL